MSKGSKYVEFWAKSIHAQLRERSSRGRDLLRGAEGPFQLHLKLYLHILSSYGISFFQIILHTL